LLETIKHDTSLLPLPYFDGNSSARALDATGGTFQLPPIELKTKPRDLFRKLKMRKETRLLEILIYTINTNKLVKFILIGLA
jgi:hypothetical protein